MRRFLFVFASIVALCLPALADTKGDAEKPPGGNGSVSAPPNGLATPASRIDPTTLFIESNVVETLYHEFAHALIDILDLPVFGPEEFAADMFSVILMNRMFDEETAIRMAYDVAHAYERDDYNIESNGQYHAQWDNHGSNKQRYYNLACLFYGAKPEQRYLLSRDLDLPDDRAETCADEFALADRSWGKVLGDLAGSPGGPEIRMDWILDNESHLTRFVSAEIDRLNQVFRLPEQLVVSVIPCGEVNAFYESAKREIIICTELSEHLANLAP